ncbi:MAG: Gfo/Idh/MocA family oxidoreductase [Lentisphaerota bacterium]
MKKIKIGQIGICHEHAAGKIVSLKKLPDIFEIAGVVDDRESSKGARFLPAELLKPYEGLKFMTEEELFNVQGLQAVTVEVPNTDLVPAALRCMERGLAMHMDKPGGEDLKLFGKLLDGCKSRNLPFQMGYMFRNNPAMQLCRKAIEQGWLGDIFEVQAGMSHNYGGDEYQEYMGKFPGGIMFNLGCHLIDLIISMLGRPARITPFLKSTPGLPDAIKNNCLTIMEYPCATVTLRACSREVDGLNRRRFKVCGAKGSVELCPLERFDGQPLQMRLTLLDGNEEYAAGTHIVDFGVKLDRYEEQMLELAKIINGEMMNPYTYEHDYLVQEVVLAAAGYTTWRK